MKKTLIALTLATLPVAAMAEVVLYGQVKAGYEFNSTKVAKNDRSPYINGLVDYGSRIGFKGQEDLGNGLKAIWQVEQKVNVAGGDSTETVNVFDARGNLVGTTQYKKAAGFGTRDSFIGLEGGFGKVRAGYISNQFNSDMGDVDPWEYGSDALGLGKFTRTGARRVSLRYDSPEFSGFSGNVQFSPRDNNDANPRSHRTKAKYGLGLNYANAGFFAKYGYEYLKNNASTATHKRNGHVHRVEAGYDANNLFVAAGYQNTRNVESYSGVAGDMSRGQELALTAGYHFGNLFPKISYAHGWDAKSTAPGNSNKIKNSKYDQIVVGADYDFSKRTSANVQAGWLREGLGQGNGKAKTTAFGAGLKHKF